MWDPTPWLIDNADHSVEVARLLAYAATNGREGVVLPADLKVEPLNVPGQGVRVAPGACYIRNGYPGGSHQTYIGRNPSEHTVTIEPTGSSGARTDLVVARIVDPQYPGAEEPTDPNAFDYIRTEVISGVSSNATRLNVDYPAIPLARINIPANTGTITASMITDLRTVATPLMERGLISIYSQGHVGDQTAHAIPTNVYGSWPITSEQRPTVHVPEWATRLDVVCHVSGAYFNGTSETVAGVRVGFGTEGSENGILIEEGGLVRGHYTIIGSHYVEPSRRGTDQRINIQAVRTRGTGRWWADYQTNLAIDYQFTGEAA